MFILFSERYLIVHEIKINSKRSHLEVSQVFFVCLTTVERQVNTSCNHNVDLAVHVSWSLNAPTEEHFL